MADVDPEVTTATAHHRKTRTRKSQSWDINYKPTIYAPLLPLPPDWTFLSDKKKAATFQLLARDSSDPYFDETPGNDRVFVRVDNSAYSFGNDNDDSNSIFADAPDDEDVEDDVGQPSGPSGTTSEIKNTGGGSAFYQNPKFKLEHLPRDVKAYDASRVQVNEAKNDDAHERSIYSVALKSVGVKVQRAVDLEVAALLDDGDLSRFGSDVEDLEEDFIVQANCPEEGVDLDADEQFDLVQEDEVTHEVVDNEFVSFGDRGNVIGEIKQQVEEAGNGSVSDKPRARRPLDDQFDLVRLFSFSYCFVIFFWMVAMSLLSLNLLELECQEYGTESDNEYDGYIAEEKETLAEKLKHVLKDKVADDWELDGGYKVLADILHATETPQSKELLDSAADVIRHCVEYGEKYENENEDEEVVIVQESSDEAEGWDCETIVSTLECEKRLAGTVSGALEIARKKRLAEAVITLRGKEKLHVDFLPRGRKASTEKVKDVSGLKSEQQKRKQQGQESKEEKKERKAAVKEERREARQAKKEMKGLYSCEAQNAQKVAAISGPSSIRLIKVERAVNERWSKSMKKDETANEGVKGGLLSLLSVTASICSRARAASFCSFSLAALSFLISLKNEDIQLQLNSIRRLSTIARALGEERTRKELIPFLSENNDDDHEVLLAMAEELGRLAAREWFTARVFSCGLFHIAYSSAPEALKTELRTIYRQLCQDDMPLVRRSAATNLGKFAATVEAAHLKVEIMSIFEELTNDDQDSVRLLTVEGCGALRKLLEPQDCVAHILPVIVNFSQVKISYCWHSFFVSALPGGY
ncbi:hypothetical protein EZV62_024330 [Acer yangbiense]|uniref:Condensin complex subunit 1 C-terminal domain-containing protein n=1 Tax=Acer yangbiense TaxID=1000413 RepID=A0A5C7H6F8_9ROSI|nr:hypothetical protein EZV62_024330 [Acer yangbiense]